MSRSSSATSPHGSPGPGPRFLRIGDKGEWVEEVERLLTTDGVSAPEDGVFTKALEAAVDRFQAEHELPITGSVGAETLAVLLASSGAGADHTPGAECTPAAPLGWAAVQEHRVTPSTLMQAALATARACGIGASSGLTYGIADPQALVRSVAVFTAMSRLIESAQHEVLIQSYEYSDAYASRALKSALLSLEARRRKESPNGPPVQVRILVDQERDHLPLGPDNLSPLEQDMASLHLDPRYVQLEVKPYGHWATGFLHAKEVIVDGREALVTGFNLDTATSPDLKWYDTGILFEGDVVHALRREYLATAAIAQLPIGADPAAGEPLGGGVPMLVIGRPPDDNPASRDTQNSQDQVFLSLFNQARHCIRAATPNLNSPPVLQALVNACQRGVRVELLLSKGFNEARSEVPFGGGPNDDSVAELERQVRALGKSGNLEIRWESDNGRSPVLGNSCSAAHVKYTSVDGQVAVVGSTNLDVQSWYHSREVDVVVDSAALARAWDAQVFLPRFDQGLDVDSPAGELGDNQPKGLLGHVSRMLFDAIQTAAWDVNALLHGGV
jgi:phosphatidylserine/phosphatidylglycerophosphate/cardiolipin synthase-like enzyme